MKTNTSLFVMVLITLSTIMISCGSNAEEEQRQQQIASEQAEQEAARQRAIAKQHEREVFASQMYSMNAVIDIMNDMYKNHSNDLTLVKNTLLATELTNCPSDFVTAFSTHRNALVRMCDAVDRDEALKSDASRIMTLIESAVKWETTETPLLDHINQESQSGREFTQAINAWKTSRDFIPPIVAKYNQQLEQMVKEKKENNSKTSR